MSRDGEPHRKRIQKCESRLKALEEKVDLLDQLVGEGQEKLIERVDLLDRWALTGKEIDDLSADPQLEQEEDGFDWHP